MQYYEYDIKYESLEYAINITFNNAFIIYYIVYYKMYYHKNSKIYKCKFQDIKYIK